MSVTVWLQGTEPGLLEKQQVSLTVEPSSGPLFWFLRKGLTTWPMLGLKLRASGLSLIGAAGERGRHPTAGTHPVTLNGGVLLCA